MYGCTHEGAIWITSTMLLSLNKILLYILYCRCLNSSYRYPLAWMIPILIICWDPIHRSLIHLWFLQFELHYPSPQYPRQHPRLNSKRPLWSKWQLSWYQTQEARACRFLPHSRPFWLTAEVTFSQRAIGSSFDNASHGLISIMQCVLCFSCLKAFGSSASFVSLFNRSLSVSSFISCQFLSLLLLSRPEDGLSGSYWSLGYPFTCTTVRRSTTGSLQARVGLLL